MFNKCDYIISTTSRKQSPNVNGLPEFIFLGRSNVGKSSFINAITNRKMLARTSSKPGKTLTINYFLIDDEFYLCDAPGYGYASRSYGARIDFGSAIEDYLLGNNNLRVVFLLVDTFVGPTKDDVLMFNYLMHYNLNVIIIATKSDKVGRSRILQYKKAIYSKLEIDPNKVILTSSQEKTGINDVINIISSYVENKNGK